MSILDFPDEPDYLRRAREALERMQAPFKGLGEYHRLLLQQEKLDRQLAPYRHMQEMERHLAPLRLWEKLQSKRSLVQPDGMIKTAAAYHAQNLLERHLPALGHGAALHMLNEAEKINALKAGFGSRAHVTDAAVKQTEWLQNLQRQATGGLSIRELVRSANTNPTISALIEARKALERIGVTFQDVELGEIEFDEAETAEAEQVVNDVTQAVGAELTLEAAVSAIVSAIESQKNPGVQLTLWFFFLKVMDWIAAGIISTLISQHMSSAAGQGAPQSVKEVRAAAHQIVEFPELLDGFRFVAVKALNVRQNPNSRSPVLSVLRFGAPVNLIRKERDFSLIVWRDKESDVELRGWVFSRYLKKFN